MALPILSSRKHKPVKIEFASLLLNDYEHWLQTHYGTVGTYKDHAKSFLKRYKSGGSLLSQLDTFAGKKSITGRSIINRFRKFLEEKGVSETTNDLKETRLPLAFGLVKLYLISSKDRLKSNRSIATYATVLNSYFRFIGELKHFEKFTAQRFIVAPGRSEFTSALYANILKSFAKWALNYAATDEADLSIQERKVKAGLSSISVRSLRDVVGIKVSVVGRKLYYKEGLNNAQRTKLLKACSTPMERSVVTLMAWNGLRPIEIERLTHKDFDFKKGILSVWGKGRSIKQKEKIVLFSVPAREMKSYLKQAKIKQGKTYPSLTYKGLYQMIQSLFGRIRLRVKEGMFTPHSLRHTAGQLLYDRGTPLEFIQRTLRHTSIQSTMVYAQKAIEKNYFKQMKQVW